MRLPRLLLIIELYPLWIMRLPFINLLLSLCPPPLIQEKFDIFRGQDFGMHEILRYCQQRTDKGVKGEGWEWVGVSGTPPDSLGKRHRAKAQLLGKNNKGVKKYISRPNVFKYLISASRYEYRDVLPVHYESISISAAERTFVLVHHVYIWIWFYFNVCNTETF